MTGEIVQVPPRTVDKLDRFGIQRTDLTTRRGVEELTVHLQGWHKEKRERDWERAIALYGIGLYESYRYLEPSFPSMWAYIEHYDLAESRSEASKLLRAARTVLENQDPDPHRTFIEGGYSKLCRLAPLEERGLLTDENYEEFRLKLVGGITEAQLEKDIHDTILKDRRNQGEITQKEADAQRRSRAALDHLIALLRSLAVLTEEEYLEVIEGLYSAGWKLERVPRMLKAPGA